VSLRSHLDRPVSGILTLDAQANLTCPQPAHAFTLPPRMKTQCEFLVTAEQAGVFATQLHFEAEGVKGSRPVVFRALAGSGALGSIEPDYDEQALLETPGINIAANIRGGWVNVYSQALDRGFGGLPMPELGPPFASWRDRPLHYPTRIERNGGETSI